MGRRTNVSTRVEISALFNRYAKSYILALSTGDNNTSAVYSVSEAAGKAREIMDTLS